MIGTMKYDDLLSIVLKSMDESPARCLNDYKHVKSPIKGCIEIRNSETLLKKNIEPIHYQNGCRRCESKDGGLLS
jgi:hypothetical protein